MRERLDEATQASGRFLVQEVEHRLENSFRDAAFFELAGDPAAQEIIRPIVYYLGILKERRLDWRRNRGATDAVRDSIALIVEAVFSKDPLSLERQDRFLTSSKEKRRGTVANEVVGQVLHVLQVSGLAKEGMPASLESGTSQ